MDLKQLESIMKLMRKHQINELALEDSESGDKLSLKVAGEPVAMTQAPMLSYAPAMMPAAPAPQRDVAPAGAKADGAGEARGLKPGQKAIKSPFVGTFYGAPSPGADPFVRVGQKVHKGDVLCIVEAMKLMNEIESEVEGVVVEILAQNEHAVEYDQVLFIVE